MIFFLNARSIHSKMQYVKYNKVKIVDIKIGFLKTFLSIVFFKFISFFHLFFFLVFILAMTHSTMWFMGVVCVIDKNNFFVADCVVIGWIHESNKLHNPSLCRMRSFTILEGIYKHFLFLQIFPNELSTAVFSFLLFQRISSKNICLFQRNFWLTQRIFAFLRILLLFPAKFIGFLEKVFNCGKKSLFCEKFSLCRNFEGNFLRKYSPLCRNFEAIDCERWAAIIGALNDQMIDPISAWLKNGPF